MRHVIHGKSTGDVLGWFDPEPLNVVTDIQGRSRKAFDLEQAIRIMRDEWSWDV